MSQPAPVPQPLGHLAALQAPCSRKAGVGWAGGWGPGCPAHLLPQRGEGLAWGGHSQGWCAEAEAVSPEASRLLLRLLRDTR